LSDDNEDAEANLPGIADWVAWLEMAPPYELIGRLICAASSVELGLVMLAQHAGKEPTKLAKMRTSKVLAYLRSVPDQGIAATELDAIEKLLETRNAIAHGFPRKLLGQTQPSWLCQTQSAFRQGL